MRAAQYLGDGAIASAEIDATAPAAGEVQIRVAYVGICGTDLHIRHGNMDQRVTLPAVIGHEMSGTIAAVGEGVTSWQVGDAVTVMPLDWDGTCPGCRAGHTHVCQNLNFIGIDSPGALQELWNVPADTLVALPEGMRLDHAALVEPVAVSVHDVRRGNVQPGDKVVVIGGGPIGLLIANSARAFGAEIVVLELDATRRATIEELGFATLNPVTTDAEAWVTEWTAGAGADVVFEVSGAAPALLTATQVAKVRGTVVIVAIHPQPKPVDLQRVFWRELTIVGARVYDRADYETAVELLATGRVPADALITHVVPLESTAAAFDALEGGGAMKVLVAVDPELATEVTR